MNKTIRLFDGAPDACEFEATVLACEKTEQGYEILLEQTLFFPEEGGQSADGGTLGDGQVTYVYEREGMIYHVTDMPLQVGAVAHGVLDYAERYRKMQNHTGEHIVSGLIFRHFGLHNVGFHLSDDGMTADFDGEITEEQVSYIESLANEVVYACRKVKGYYPDAEALANMQYRSKLELTENVRIVEIEGVDLCACCAPHVANTGEVGMVRILERQRYKGGVRLYMKCGRDALDGCRADYLQLKNISMAISAEHDKVDAGVARVLDDMNALRAQISDLKRELLPYKLEKIPFTEGNLCLFEADGDMLFLRNLVNAAKEKCTGIVAAFAGNDEKGYKYILSSKTVDLRLKAKEINAAIGGRGGGSPEMIQGSATEKRAVIESYFQGLCQII